MMTEKNSEEIDIDEERFVRWIERLRQTTQTLVDLHDNNQGRILIEEKDTTQYIEQLIYKIRQNIANEENSLPKWLLKRKNRDEIISMIATADDLKFLLRHFITPHAYQAYLKYKQDYANIGATTATVSGGEEATTAVNIFSTPTTENISKFFRTLNNSSQDELLSLCRLADVFYRIKRADVHDSKHMSSRLEKETEIQTKAMKKYQKHQFAIDQLNESNQNSLIVKSKQIIKSHLNTKMDTLREAEAEEEKARLAYELAIAKRKEVNEQVNQMKEAIEYTNEQCNLLFQINAKRVEVDQYNIQNNKERITIFQSLQHFLQTTQSKFYENRVKTEIKELLNVLFSLFQSSKVTSPSSSSSGNSEDNLYYFVHVAIETIRLWKNQLSLTSDNDINGILTDFHNFLISISAKLECPSPSLNYDSLYGDNATIVLYYDHVIHNTPPNHVESPARVDTSIALLNSQVNNGCSPNMRLLRLLKCNDIVSPPLWCLPLVHAPQYLSQLWNLSQEAKQDDLLVPLEFDTEWESLDESENEFNISDEEGENDMDIEGGGSSSSSLTKTNRSLLLGRGRYSKILKSIDFPKEFNEMFNISKHDDILAKLINPSIPQSVPSNSSVSKKKRPSDEKESSSANAAPGAASGTSRRGRKKAQVPEDAIEAEVPVTTMYGKGALLCNEIRMNPKYLRPDNDIFPVKMEWGARAYLNKSIIDVTLYRKYAGLTRAKIRTILYADYSNVKSLVQPNDNRFVGINPVLYTAITAIIGLCASQTILSDTLGIDRPKLSLWVHGRTSTGVNGTMEMIMKEWLYNVDAAEIERRVAAGDKSRLLSLLIKSKPFYSNPAPANVTVEDFDIVPLVSSGILEKLRTTSSRLATDRQSSDEDSDGSTDGDKKSRKPKSSNQDMDVDEDDLEGDSGEDRGFSRQQVQQRKRSSTVPTVVPPTTRPEDKLLHDLTKQIMDENKISQASIGRDFNVKYNFPVDQHKMSQWTRYRLSPQYSEQLGRCIVKWLLDNKTFFYSRPLALTYIKKYSHWQENLLNGTASVSDYQELIKSIEDLSEFDCMETLSKWKGLIPLEVSLSSIIMDTSTQMEDEMTDPEMVGNRNELLEFIQSTKIGNLSEMIQVTINELNRRKYSLKSFIRENISHFSPLSDNFDELVNLILPVLHTKTLNDTPVTLLVCRLLIEWLYVNSVTGDQSVTLNKYPNPQTTPAASKSISLKNPVTSVSVVEGVCQFCGQSRDSYPSDRSFAMHISWCFRKQPGNGGGLNVRINKPKDSLDCNDESSVTSPVVNPGTTQQQGRVIPPAAITTTTASSANIPSSSKHLIHTVFGDDDDEESKPSKRIKLSDLGMAPLDLEKLAIPAHVPVAAPVPPAHAPVFQNVHVSSIIEHAHMIQGLTPLPLEGPGTLSEFSKMFLGSSEPPPYAEETVITADKFPAGSHYAFCEYCRQGKNLILCKRCPCAYHSACMTKRALTIKPTVDEQSMEDSGFCFKCTESRADTSLEMPGNEFNSLIDKWVLLYSTFLRRWRPAYVILNAPRSGVFLLKFWRADSRGGKSYYMDLTGARVLLLSVPPELPPATPVPVASAPVAQKSSRKSVSKSETAAIKKELKAAAAVALPPKKEIIEIKDPVVKQEEAKVEDSDSEDEVIGMTDTYLSAESLQAALCAAGAACRAIDIVMNTRNTNVFCCTRPPGHHAGRYGCTDHCLSTGFCLLNNAVIAALYGRVRWNLQRIAIIDFDVHFGNGTASLTQNDSGIFFASVHMVYNDPSRPRQANEESQSFYPEPLGATEIAQQYVSIGVQPSRFAESDETSNTSTRQYGGRAYRHALKEIVSRMTAFQPELLIISAGFDGYVSDPVGGDLNLSLDDYRWSTQCLIQAMDDLAGGVGCGRVISLLEGGYDTSKETLGLANCVNAHVESMRLLPQL